MARQRLVPGPDHPITIQPADKRITVRAGDRVIADSANALTLQEASYPPVRYVPLADVDQSLLKRTGTATYCPYKGDASYHTVVTPDGEITDAVWTYEEPYPAVAAIGGHVAFYPDRVTIEETPLGHAR